VGRHAVIGGYSVITRDVAPYSTTSSARDAKAYGANKIGLERRGFQPATIDSLQKAFRLLTSAKLNTSQAVARIREEIQDCPEVEELIEFIDSSDRGVITG
jgi:UDP-N-acetylglucosamine acyltransferase